MTVTAAVFDIGNVLIEWNPERYYDWAIGRAQREAFFAEVDMHHMNNLVDGGAPFQETVTHWAARHPDWAAEITMWRDHWLEMASPQIDGSVHLLRALRVKGIPVFALTNFGAESFIIAKERYDFLSEFDRTYVSAHLGCIKPDPEIYAHLERDCAIPPNELLFTDDRADNIAGAKARGWQTHHFEGWQGWARRLMDEGLLTQAEARL